MSSLQKPNGSNGHYGRRVQIVGTGSYLPSNIVANRHLERIPSLNTTDEWIRAKTGIIRRRFVPKGTLTSDIAVEASLSAIEAARMDKQCVDMVVLATSTPDRPMPPSGPTIQHKLGLPNVGAFDVDSVCTSFICALMTAYGAIATGNNDHALVIGADTYSRILNPKDRTTFVFFGDGAGAMLLAPSDDPDRGILKFALWSSGAGNDVIKQNDEYYFCMEGRKVYEFAIEVAPRVIREALRKSGVAPEEVDWLILHQPNVNIDREIARRLGISEDKLVLRMFHVGNTAAASIPEAFDWLVRQGKTKPGQIAVFAGFGGGLSAGAVVVRL
jgi:3-oxoacyl-[acyl-carrier-protein] synthase-3